MMKKMMLSIAGVMSALAVSAVNISADIAKAAYYTNATVITLTNSQDIMISGSGTIDVILIGGGGGGGANRVDLSQGGGGGGGGGVILRRDVAVSAGVYPIEIGSGGTTGVIGNATGTADNGGNTTAFGITAQGGGGGANYSNNGQARQGRAGASGGGSTAYNATAVGGASIAAQGEYGNDGGGSNHLYGPGGGGGAGAPGVTSGGSAPGGGGDGIELAVYGDYGVYYGGGGAGYRQGTFASGGKGGGGSRYEKGVDGLGGGGSGGYDGGCGAVVIKFTPTPVSDTKDFLLTGGDEKILLTNGTVHVFRQSGKLTVAGSGCVEVLMVGGGGGGGNHTYAGGGGGAGGLVHISSARITAGEYDIIVGAGGAVGANGGDSSFLGALAHGGGAGGYNSTGSSGGSGGGGSTISANKVPGGSAVFAIDGNIGDVGGASGANIYAPGGGGGAGGPGEDGVDSTSGTANIPGDGGDGLAFDITGDNVWYAGGGGGGEPNRGAKGGKGGGGDSHVAGVDGLGGGGGGYAAGGDGIVIVRYAKKSFYRDYIENATGGTVTRSEGCNIHTFTEDGTFSLPEAGVVEFLMVGGGGGGGVNLDTDPAQGGAGGGAGGLIYRDVVVLNAGTHQVKIGAGGNVGENGGNTEFVRFVAYGGGHGGGRSGNARKPASGGSGGGGIWISGGAYVPGQAIHGEQGNLGNDGGECSHVYAAAGGGGAGAVGGNSNGTSPGIGGDGLAFDISGTLTYYAGGGSGYRKGSGYPAMSQGGLGGGGPGGQNGVDGLGGGGGGNAAGGSGVVIIRYLLPKKGFVVICK
ncbi:MAG TPA: hypothetical protein PLJ32_00785 [Kiritimatiellia bacterium]|jgi:hypothetical protein|nr:hypothetical protein [Kiritimatiellia bacterium]HPW74491.1 hypothetical protein [Kiritimatiellia bacterium]